MKILLPIQVLRALAALAVMIGHFQGYTATAATHYWLSYSNVAAAGVDLFFVISGFIMVYTSAPLFAAPGGPQQFLVRRAIRIVPLYWLATTFYIVLAAVLPMSITAWYNYTSNVAALTKSERRNLERLALATSGRLSQLVEDSRRTAAYLVTGDDVADLLAHPADDFVRSFVGLDRANRSLRVTEQDGRSVVTDADGRAVGVLS